MMAEVFSDRVSRIRGITTRPAWKWSTSYRRWHTGLIHAQATVGDTQSRDARRTRAYNDWLRQRDLDQ